MPGTILFEETLATVPDGDDINSGNSGLTATVGIASTIKAATVNGRKCAEIVLGATAAVTHLQRLGLGSLTSDVYFRYYFDKGATDVGTNWFDAMRGLDSAAARAFNIGVSAASDFTRVANAADTEDTGARGTTTIPASTWVRYEIRVTPSTTVGQIQWKMWSVDPESTGTPNDDHTTTTATALLASIDGARWGVTSTPTNQNGRTMRYAQFAMGIGDWLGPAVPAEPNFGSDIEPRQNFESHLGFGPF